MYTVLFIFGTRPEAIKLAPLVIRLRDHAPDMRPRICVTAQHRGLLDQVLDTFRLKADHDLNVMQAGQTLGETSSRILAALEGVFAAEKPDLVVVQGDTTSTFCGALSAFYHQVPVAHVEAGLRTGDLTQPFPEELNRVLTARMAAIHLAPTEQAAENLKAEGIHPETIEVTGNTGIDALFFVRDGLASGRLPAPDWPELDARRRLILVTAHRRESFGAGFEEVCRALEQLSQRSGLEIAFPMHPNPNVRKAFADRLGRLKNVHLLPPLDYVPFVDLMRRSYAVVTDSGGVQEEAPSLGKPVLVLREKTERSEAIDVGTVLLVGRNSDRIIAEINRLLDNPAIYQERSRAHNPYGDGHACERICNTLRNFLNVKSSKMKYGSKASAASSSEGSRIQPIRTSSRK